MNRTRTRRMKGHSEENNKMKKKLKNNNETKGEHLRRPEILSSRRRLKWKSTT